MEESIYKKMCMAGKTALVMGGSKGIGKGYVRALLEVGANVAFVARGEADGRKTEAEFAAAFGPGRCLFIRCDVSVDAEVQWAVQQAVDRFGSLDSLINNAGYHPPYEQMDDIPGDMFRELLDVNLVSMYVACRAAFPHLRETHGTIINTASLVGVMGQKQSARYVATKGAIIALTKAMAIDEAKHGVRVNCIAPGCILTPLGEEFSEKSGVINAFKCACEWSHLDRVGTIDECGAACVFFASPMSSFITGVTLPLSGGAELAYGNKFYE